LDNKENKVQGLLKVSLKSTDISRLQDGGRHAPEGCPICKALKESSSPSSLFLSGTTKNVGREMVKKAVCWLVQALESKGGEPQLGFGAPSRSKPTFKSLFFMNTEIQS
jgi:hypothetical protein